MNIKIICSLLLMVVVLSCTFFNNNVNATLKTTQVHVENKSINTGKLKQNVPKVVVFKFENSGANSLLIQNVETSCGCTVPEWTKKPIKPGKSGEIKVTYDAKYPGNFHKTITVFANVENSPLQLSISGEVAYDETILSKQ
jgi:hypothetical protein